MEGEKTIQETVQNEIACSNCSAKLKFSPGTNSLKCEYCGTVNEIEISEEEIEEIDFDKFLNENDTSVEKQEIVTIKCNSCGAETTLDPNIVSDSCAFCGSNIVLTDGTSCSIIKPKSLLPFIVDSKKAFTLFRTWIKKLWWAPSALKKFAKLNKKIAGMYIPFWTYDSNTTCQYRGQRGDNYTTTETYSTVVNGKSVTKTRTVTRIRWRSASGSVNNKFDDVLVVATTSLPKKYLEKLEPWDLDSLIPFDEKYLSGFRTESYQVGIKEGFDDAKIKMTKEIKVTVKKDIGGDHQRISKMNTKYNDITFKHILLPVWISAYKFKDKVYRFMINARTGEVQGERPYSWIKITLAVLAVLAIIAAIVLVVQYYNGGEKY